MKYILYIYLYHLSVCGSTPSEAPYENVWLPATVVIVFATAMQMPNIRKHQQLI